MGWLEPLTHSMRLGFENFCEGEWRKAGDSYTLHQYFDPESCFRDSHGQH